MLFIKAYCVLRKMRFKAFKMIFYHRLYTYPGKNKVPFKMHDNGILERFCRKSRKMP